MAAALRPELPGLADEILEAIRAEVPEYDRPFRGEFGRGIRTGVHEALARFVALMEDPEAPRLDVYRALGRGELRQGRSLDALQAAYRIGARIAWRRLSAAAEAAGIPVADQHALAEAIFAYIDELAAESVEGYAAAQEALAGERQRRHQALLALLFEPAGASDAATLRRTAAEAGWPVPRSLAVIACGGRGGSGATAAARAAGARGAAVAARVARRLAPDALHGTAGGVPVVVIPHPAALDAGPVAAALGVRLGVGPTVAVAEAPRSLDWAVRALALPGPAGEAAVAERRLADLVVHGTPGVATALATSALAALDAETPASRARLEETLASWLRHQGRRAAIAAELHVHPQTVRYRVSRLRELLGERLDDPEERFVLELALRAASVR